MCGVAHVVACRGVVVGGSVDVALCGHYHPRWVGLAQWVDVARRILFNGFQTARHAATKGKTMNHHAESIKTNETTTDYMYNGESVARVITAAHAFEDIDDAAAESTPVTVASILSAFPVTEGTARKWLREGRLTTLESLVEQRDRGYSFHRNYSSEPLIDAMTGA